MERSTTSKNVSNYKMLAKYYDELLQDEEALNLWLKYIEAKPFKNVLELASGSGVMAKILDKKGYNVIASDISKDMKKAAKNNFHGKYLVLDMTDYDLHKYFDLVLCICDSINYLNEDKLNDFFRCAYNHLNNDGRLIFDMHNTKRIREFNKSYIEEGYVDDLPYQWTIKSNSIDNTINEHFTFYCKDGMIQEHHIQNVFDIKTIEKYASKYFKLKFIKSFVKDEKILVIGEKK